MSDNPLVIEFTFEQQLHMQSIFSSMPTGSTVIAQVYGNGIRMKVLTPEQSVAVSDVLGGDHTRAHNCVHEAAAQPKRLLS
jgi:hypothetical protein